MILLGIKHGHDAGAAILRDGRILAATAEERFTRIKHDASFPFHSIAFCLSQAGVEACDVDVLAYPSERPHLDQLAQCLTLPAAFGPAPGTAKSRLPHGMKRVGLRSDCLVHLCDHHRAHAACAYHLCGAPRGERRLVFTLDGLGDGVSTAVWEGQGNTLRPLYRCGAEGSLGWFFSAVTEALGWRHGDGEGTLMAFAALGRPEPCAEVLRAYCPAYEHGELSRAHDFGKPGVFVDHGARLYSLNDAVILAALAGLQGRENLAAAAQQLLQEEVLGLVRAWSHKVNCRDACFAGGVFLNVKLNQMIWTSGLLDSQCIYPDAGDSGLPLGAALDAYFSLFPEAPPIVLPSVYLGPEYDDEAVGLLLRERKLGFTEVDDPAQTAAGLLEQGDIVGWFQGRMEIGPRALGARSILMRPDNERNKDFLNSHVKFREAFRPFCPSVLDEAKEELFENCRHEPHMITAFTVRKDKLKSLAAACHVDGTARPQTVRAENNPLYHRLLSEMRQRTGVPALLNTSLNIKGEPIVCRPREAIRCFFDTGMDSMLLGRYLLRKKSSRG